MTQTRMLSIVLPIYNEESTLPELHRRLTEVMEAMGHSYELVFVDDGSTDQSHETLKRMQAEDAHIRILKFSRNFGHHIALTAGLDHAQGDAVVLMDADLQDQPEEIPKLFETYVQGFDVVVGIRRNKKFPWYRRVLSQSFRWLLKRGLGVTFVGGVFRILSRRVVEEVKRCRESDRMLLGLIQWVGFRQTYVDVEHGARYAGTSKYSFRKQWELARNTLLTFSTTPLRLGTHLGSLFLFVSLFGLLYRLWSGGWSALSGWPVVTLLVLFVGGIQLVCTGILGSYLARVVHDTRSRPLYVMEEDSPPKQSLPPKP